MSYNHMTNFPRGLQPKLQDLRLGMNKMVFLSRHDFAGLSNLRNLELSYNRLQGMEAGSLESLTALQSIDLSGNNWQCDCYLRPLKQFLESHALHKGQRDKLLCGGQKLNGKEIDLLQVDEMACDDVKFEMVPLKEEKAVTVFWEQPADFIPPFVQFKLKISRVTDTGKIIIPSIIH